MFARIILSRCLALLAGLLSLPALAQNPATTVSIDANLNRRAIDPRIYGVNFATSAQLADLNSPLNRSGGNTTTTYNWLQNAANHDFDYFFQSLSEGTATPGEAADTFVQTSKTGLAQPMLTIPMIGWVAKLGPGRSKLTSFSIAKYGPQCSNDFLYYPDSGDGLKPDCTTFVTGNDPNDAYVPSDSNFQKAWVQHLVAQWGTAAAGGVKYYILDNEHSIWFSTHRDVFPVGPHATDIRDRMIDYATMIRTVDPGAIIVGPEEYGWTGYIFSGYDQQWSSINGYNNIPDRTLVMGGMDYMPWLLQQLKASAVATGKRPIDVFSLHYYPQENEFSDTVDNATQLRRNRSTRSLWDPAYRDTSWINDFVTLIPRMRGWTNTNYFPDVPIAITEYNWGAEGHINGATTQADIYGIFGREGLDIATRWTTPATNSPVYNAMKMYRNYDGNKSTFGDVSVRATVANPDNLSAFAALRNNDGAMTVMIINKVLINSTPVTVSLANFVGTGTAQVWQLTSANAINRLADIGYAANSLAITVPPQSITLLVLPPVPPGFALQSAASRKRHAGNDFDVPLATGIAIAGNVSVEPRQADAFGQRVVFKFTQPVTDTGSVTVVDRLGAAVPFSAAMVGTELIVTVPALPNNSRLTVASTNVNNAGVNVAVSAGFFIGDVTGTRAVNAGDVVAIKAHATQLVSTQAANARFNVTLSGTVGATDVSQVKARTGNRLQ